jgi:hypothetical protein
MGSAAVMTQQQNYTTGRAAVVGTGGVEEIWVMRTVGSGYSGAVSKRCHMLYLREAQTVRSL